ncbi:MAG TPA: trypsin-like peptidase domain-containing protein [Isosphaeraceae bacterium]|nr:trypsin-like peptidase domain-containing protein [Isosphaeraceae bacterium]
MKRNPVAWAALIVASAALVSSRGFLRPIPAAPKVTDESQRTAKALSEAFGGVAEFTRPSVVQISVQKKVSRGLNVPGMRRFQLPVPRGNNPGDPGQDFEELLRRFLNPDGAPQREQFGFRASGVGSGFVYDNKGHIVTNHHVVDSSEKITVTFYDGVKAEATLVGADDKSDVAVIKVDNTSYPPLPKGDSSKLKVGELVMAVGSPFALSQSVTTGIISALERNAVGINEYESFIQTDAAINRGNSGGPLVDMNGTVIGVNSAIVSGSSGNDGIGFAIPMNMVTSVANMLIKDGKVHYARIGIALEPMTPALARQLGLEENVQGVLVDSVNPGSPAEKAGIKQGDVITGFAGEKVVNGSSFRLKVATSEVAKPHEIVFLRDGKQRSAQIVPAPAGDVVFAVERESTKPADAEKASIGDFGLDVQQLTAELAKPLGLPADQKGLVVTSVKEGSPAEAAGIQDGDVITKVIRDRKIQPLGTIKEFKDVASKTNEIALYVQSGKAGRFVTLSKATK